MGYMRHHAIVCTSWSEAHIQRAHAEATTIGLACSPVSGPAINFYRSFCVFPDGSNEGWGDSDAGDARRDKFIAWLEAHWPPDDADPEDGTDQCYIDWAEVQYGDGNGVQGVLRAHDFDEVAEPPTAGAKGREGEP